MKTLNRLFLFLAISLFVVSCTPEQLLSETTDSSVETLATGDGDNSGTDDDKDGDNGGGGGN